jgi:GxxExxY protein
MSLLHTDVSDAIIKSYYHVYNTLGYGFLERVYENSLSIALRRAGLKVEQQVRSPCVLKGRLLVNISLISWSKAC